LDEDTLLAVFEGVPMTSISQSEFQSVGNVTDLLTDTSKNLIFPSKGEARRMIKGGGVSINKVKLSSEDQEVDFKLLQDKYLLAQKGKKNYFLIAVE
jgi:tyrosyl-tRNA synthetase